jgi:hypothetical protein
MFLQILFSLPEEIEGKKAETLCLTLDPSHILSISSFPTEEGFLLPFPV